MAPPKSIIRNRVKSKDKNGNNGKGTFNKTSKQNKYDMKDIHFQATRVSKEEGGGAGCMGSNCAKACCMFSIDIVGIGKSTRSSPHHRCRHKGNARGLCIGVGFAKA